MANMLKNTRAIDHTGLKKLVSRSCRLPEDVLVQIISYLPAKVFFKLLPVCKTLCRLSLDSHFLLLQSYRNKTISGIIVIGENILRSFIRIDHGAGMPNNSLEFLSKTGSILGSAGGLVFILLEKYEMFRATTVGICVCNPARGTQCCLPPPSGACFRGGVAVRFINDGDGVTKDYKLVYLTQTYGLTASHHCRVYDSVARAWTMDKEVDFGPQQLNLEDPVVCGDIVYWVSSDLESYVRDHTYVVAFDVRDECTQIILLPRETVTSFHNIYGITLWEGKWLCLIHYGPFTGVFGLWLLKKTSSSVLEWVKMHEISLAQMGFTGKLFFVSYVKLIEVATTMMLVFTAHDTVYSYNIKDGGACKKLDSLGLTYFPKLIAYSNTLRPCGDQEELLEAI
ncbi:hypothetical protein B296_00049094 [Ensete ventricosum]|uniref:F-box domain-containing protein n=1 Tax=Ensete ventricosum TaxID=4639 RepID=A0A426YA83_ENSVE|nr:hypothetical protein B296_00049094 [Ensete ventricosum]